MFSYSCSVVDDSFAVGENADGPRGQIILHVLEGEFCGKCRVEVGKKRSTRPSLGSVDMDLRFVTSKSQMPRLISKRNEDKNVKRKSN